MCVRGISVCLVLLGLFAACSGDSAPKVPSGSEDGSGAEPDSSLDGSEEPALDGSEDAPGEPGAEVGVVADPPEPAHGCGTELVPVDGECVERRQPTHLAPGWTEIKPGGDTLCVDGDEFSFFVRPGTVNKGLFFMQGGGACWDAVTCALPAYTRTAEPPDDVGILDPNNPDNPFKDWHAVYIPYCSADVAFGNVDQQYLLNTTHHRGFKNAEAVRHWVYENMTSPDFALVSGCSAGAVGVVMHGTYMAEAYKENPDVRAALVTDSFQGIIPPDFVGMENWNAVENIPPWLPELKEPPFSMTRAIQAGAPLYPEALIANFNYADDAIQGTFYTAMGGNGAQIGQLIDEAVHTLADTVPNYRFFTAPGSSHCVFHTDGVYECRNLRQLESFVEKLA